MPASSISINGFQLIAWLIALVEFVLGLYILALNPWHASNRYASILILLNSGSAFLLGILVATNAGLPANLPMQIMAAISPAIPPWILLTSAVLLKPDWLQGRWKPVFQAVYGLAFLPGILTLIDSVLSLPVFKQGSGTRLWFTGLPAGYTAGGFIALRDFTLGVFGPSLRFINLSLISFLTLVPLAYVVFLDKPGSPSEQKPAAAGQSGGVPKRLGSYLLATQIFAILLAIIFQVLGSRAGVYDGVNILVTSAVFSLAYAYASLQQMISERRFQRGNLQVRLPILLLTGSLPVLFALAAFLMYRFGIFAGQIAAPTQPGLNQAATGQFLRQGWIALAIGVVLLSAVTWFTVRQAFQPIQSLTKVVNAISAGDLERTAPVEGDDEIGSLANAFNHMTEQLRVSIADLEQRVEIRTAEANRRVIELQAAAQVAREAAAIRDLKRLLTQTTILISERFGFYHAGIFLVDDTHEYAILQAANSPGGQRMLARGHKLQVGIVGIVGHVASTGKPRIALNVGEDSVYFNNPDLPLTRSEMALPLKARGQVIGVLDVQSTEPAAFTEADVEILQILADQIALAIENARLLEDRERAIQELKAQYGETTREVWKNLLSGKTLAYVYNRLGVESATSAPSAQLPISDSAPQPSSGLRQIALPLIVRDQTLGSIVLRREEDQDPWTAADYSLAEEAAHGISQALENARLFADIQRRAQVERTIGELAARAQASLDLETLMKTAVREVALATSATRVQIRLGSSNAEQVNGGGDGGDPSEASAMDQPGEDGSPKKPATVEGSGEVQGAPPDEFNAFGELIDG